MLAGRQLTLYEVLQVSTTFACVDIPEVKEKTPPPKPDHTGSSTQNPWTIEDDDRELLNSSHPKLTGKKSMHSYSHLTYTIISPQFFVTS
jgi:hypothetical protein